MQALALLRHLICFGSQQAAIVARQWLPLLSHFLVPTVGSAFRAFAMWRRHSSEFIPVLQLLQALHPSSLASAGLMSAGIHVRACQSAAAKPSSIARGSLLLRKLPPAKAAAVPQEPLPITCLAGAHSLKASMEGLWVMRRVLVGDGLQQDADSAAKAHGAATTPAVAEVKGEADAEVIEACVVDDDVSRGEEEAAEHANEEHSSLPSVLLDPYITMLEAPELAYPQTLLQLFRKEGK